MASEREGQTETQSTTTTVRKMILKPEHLREQPSVLRSMYRRLDITDTSFFHAVIMIATGITIVLQNASTYNIFEWTSTFYKSPTTDSIRYLFCFSIGYFVYDTIFVLRKVKRQNWHVMSDDFGYIFHHVVCVYGLIYPILYAKDGPVVLCGFLMGEFSNPPRFFAEHLGYELEEIRTLVKQDVCKTANITPEQVKTYYRYIATPRRICAALHYYLFIFFRAVMVYYAIAIMLPLCELTSSLIAGVLILLFSVATVFFVYAERQALPKDFYDAESLFPSTTSTGTDSAKAATKAKQR